jgi:hypothetical protein
MNMTWSLDMDTDIAPTRAWIVMDRYMDIDMDMEMDGHGHGHEPGREHGDKH